VDEDADLKLEDHRKGILRVFVDPFLDWNHKRSRLLPQIRFEDPSI
jgi:phage/plasmid-associated DNA primase